MYIHKSHKKSTLSSAQLAKQRSAASCGAVRCRALPCGAVLCRAVPCFLFCTYQVSIRYMYVRTYVESLKKHTQLSSAQLSSAAPCGAVPCRAVWCCVVRCCAFSFVLSYLPVINPVYVRTYIENVSSAQRSAAAQRSAYVRAGPAKKRIKLLSVEVRQPLQVRT